MNFCYQKEKVELVNKNSGGYKLMGRRSYGLSMTTINKIVSSMNSERKESARKSLISSQQKISREQDPQYALKEFDFNCDSKIAHISFLETTYYRKIVRYVTQNYTRYPIYGDWISKSKTIKKTIKLNNENLENLKYNTDFLFAQFSYEIVSKLNNPDLFPSWFVIETLYREERIEIKNIKEKYNYLNQQEELSIDELNEKIIKQNSELNKQYKEVAILEENLNKKNKSITKAKSRSHYWLFTIITFGLYALKHSRKRVCKLECEKKEIIELISDKNSLIKSITLRMKHFNEKIDECKKKICTNNTEEKNKIDQIIANYNEKLSTVEPLPVSLNDCSTNDFIPLKKLSGMQYEKIIGCYVIHNCENNKYYVGQSKDVMKRICKQHFDGTNIKNIIFAEDFYNSKLNNKDDLFEVKIIRLNTKDELDEMERDLIEEYDSFKNGYNGTNGNR